MSENLQAPEDKIPENIAVPEVYSQTKKNILLLTVAPFAFFIFFLLINLPLGSKVDGLIEDKLLKNRACKMNYQSFELSYFFPGLGIDNLQIPKRCYGNTLPNELSFDHVSAGMSFPSFWPIGVKTKVDLKVGTTHIQAFPRLTLSGHTIQIEQTTITSDLIDQLTPQPQMVKGNIDIKGNIEIKANALQSADLLISSKDLFLPKQSIQGIPLPALPIKKLEVAATAFGNEVQIKALRLGGIDSPLQAEAEGKLNLSKSGILNSNATLKGKVRLGDEIIEALPIIRLLLNGKPKKDGYYFFTFSGTPRSPKFNFVDPQ